MDLIYCKIQNRAQNKVRVWRCNGSVKLSPLSYKCEIVKLSSESPSPKSSPKVKSKVKSKVRSWKDLGLSPGTWTLLTLLSLLHHHPPTTTLNFSDTSRGPTTKCYTFLETSHDSWLGSQLECKTFANFLQPYFATPQYEHFKNSLLFWKSNYLSQ